ncbi:universal stress protein [Salipaludibacillus sp. LMS25]|jgi:nucleotide-binding universal stress UspA family protein|uniref:universal stress protein n=1 Tax=Salipaludibacillus sp. LMS25 TaxID=2924031 RepID=UPI0020D03293|nr:universal stress protein [Salipaludibacillus sp. LMS25]UTR13356.1 universal stress protein [Salipaludibacillus sp. LMS25]
MFKNLLLAIDGSAHSIRAADKAISLALLEEKASIEILYVVAGSKSKTDVLHYGDSDSASRKRQEMLQPFEDKIREAKIATKTTILHGRNGVAESIIEHANHGEYDTLVIGSRGLGTVQTMVLGSVSHKVIKHVKAPVLMVK